MAEAGRWMERVTARYLEDQLGVTVERRRARGTAGDRGDLGLVAPTHATVVVECKNHATLDLAGWRRQVEAAQERTGADVAVVAHKRARHGEPADQWVTMTLADFALLLSPLAPGALVLIEGGDS